MYFPLKIMKEGRKLPFMLMQIMDRRAKLLASAGSLPSGRRMTIHVTSGNGCSSFLYLVRKLCYSKVAYGTPEASDSKPHLLVRKICRCQGAQSQV